MNTLTSYLHSPSFEASARPRSSSNLSVYSPEPRGIRKQSISRSRSDSTSKIAQHPELLPTQIRLDLDLSPAPSLRNSWSTPGDSPQPHSYFDLVNQNPSVWSVPTPPHSDSGLPSLISDSGDSTFTATSSDNLAKYDPPTTSAGMASISYLLPSQYGPLGIEEQSVSSSGYTFDPVFRTSLPHQQSQQPYDFGQSEPSYGQASFRTTSPGPILPQSSQDYNAPRAYSIGHAPTESQMARNVSSSLPTQSHSAMGSSYTSTYDRTPSLYDTSVYGSPLAPSFGQHPQVQPHMSYSPPANNQAPTITRTMSSSSSGASVRVLNQKPKPQCWEHGCNGREFSTFSNLLRHQREKSGSASKSYCPRCGAEFTRTTARNGHLAHEKCTKPRRASDGR